MRNLSFVVLACLMAAPLAARIANPAKTPAKAEAKTEAIVGCKETKLYHKADCKWVKEVDKAGTRVDFKSVAAAKKAGMKPCEDCKPGS
jgi:methylphosphotriester-DNA--protein-cysteine methyltransferase